MSAHKNKQKFIEEIARKLTENANNEELAKRVLRDLSRLSFATIRCIRYAFDGIPSTPNEKDLLDEIDWTNADIAAKQLATLWSSSQPHRKIEAIKIIRGRCSIGFREAKEVIDKVWRY